MSQVAQESVPALQSRKALAPLWRECAVVAGVCVFLFFYGLLSFGLVGADEPRYAQIAREMLERRDWVVPVLYGKPWLEKPILYYWQAMVSYSIFGVSDWAARLPVALDATMLVAAVYAFARRFLRGVQLDAALVAASMAVMIGFARAASTDMPLTAMFSIAMLAWLAWHQTGAAKWLAAFYVFMGFATLAKGPVAPFLATAIICTFAAIRRDPHVVIRTLQVPGILLYIAVALPWYVAVQVRVPEFFRIFFLEHNLARYSSDLYRHSQPFWYYLPVLLVGLLPWSVLAITAAVRALRGVRAGTSAASRHVADRKLVVLLWAVLPVVFFSFSGSKLPGYILPAIPGWALLVAEWLHTKLLRGDRTHWGIMLAHSLLAGVLLATALLSQYLVYRLRPPAQAYEVATAAAAVVSLGSAVLLIRLGGRLLRLVTLVPVVVGLAFLVKVGSPAIDATQSARPVHKVIQELGRGGAPVAGWNVRRETEYGLAYYLNRPVAMYNRDERPATDHVLVVGSNAKPEGVRAYWIGNDAPQHLDIYWVEAGQAGAAP